MGFLNIGPGELLLIMVIALIVFGPGKLPEIGASVGRAIREFQRATNQITTEFTREVDDLKSPVQAVKDTVQQVGTEVASMATLTPTEASPAAAQPQPEAPAVQPEPPAAAEPQVAVAEPIVAAESVSEEVRETVTEETPVVPTDGATPEEEPKEHAVAAISERE